MKGTGATRVMVGIRLIEPFNISRGTASIAIPSSTNTPSIKEVPITHLRPYVSSLDGTPWTSDNPADAIHPQMHTCSEPGCTKHATHNDGTTDTPY